MIQIPKFNRSFARSQWRKSFGGGSFWRRQKRVVNHYGDIRQQSSWSIFAHGIRNKRAA